MNRDDFISYLSKHGINEVKQRGDEVSFPCPFSGCDDDHRSSEEYHCSFNLEKCTFYCFKCGEKGNFIKLLKHFGDYEEYDAEQRLKKLTTSKKGKPSLETTVKRIHNNSREMIRDYFNERGINNASIDKYMLGAGVLGGHRGLIIPIFDKNGKIAYVKIRRAPEDESSETIADTMHQESAIQKYRVYPSDSQLILVGEDQLAKSTSSDVLICEGELDRIIAIQDGVEMPVVSGGGALIFKNEWVDALKNMRNIYICFDRDEAGEKGFENLANKLAERIPTASIFKITLPFDENTHADLTDYFKEKRGSAKELFTKYAEFYCGKEPIDASQFKEMTVEEIADVLDSTIKYDFIAKSVVFLAMVLTYTESDQLNIMVNGDSSTGKSYIVTEVGKLFPKQDVIPYGKTTPNAFYYSQMFRKKDEETGQMYIDLERRILIFTEQPDSKLQENIRSLLSHDDKRIPFAITNKGKKGENAAIEGYILGFPSTFFCSANMRVNEQEQTRCLIISPETTKKKVLASIDACIDRSKNKSAYDAKIERNERRQSLKERILYIKSLGIETINIDDSEYLRRRFMEERGKAIQPKAQRDISHFISLVKAMALINAPFRLKDGKIIAINKDVDEAMKLWKPLSKNTMFGVSPQVLNFHTSILIPAFRAKNNNAVTEKEGATYKEIAAEYYDQTGCYPNMDTIKDQYIPALETASLISRSKLKRDRRADCFTPLVFFDDDSSK